MVRRLNPLVRNPLISFFALTALISWAIWTPIVIQYYRNPFPVSFEETPIYLILLAFLGFFGPTIAALILSGLEGGREEIKRLLSGWKLWRVGLRWYLAFFLSQLAIEFLANQLYIGQSNATLQIDWGNWAGFLPTFLQAALIGGAIAEETGWRGFALPRLQEKRSALSASVIIGLIWGAWHLPISLVPGANFPVELNLTLFAVFVLNAVFISIVMTWLYNNTGGSIFICYLYHALLNTGLLSAIYKFKNLESAWWGKMYYGTVLRGAFALLLVAYFGARWLSRTGENPLESSPT
jgi:membrane protease YdiL (CAAX protease family)